MECVILYILVAKDVGVPDLFFFTRAYLHSKLGFDSK